MRKQAGRSELPQNSAWANWPVRLLLLLLLASFGLCLWIGLRAALLRRASAPSSAVDITPTAPAPSIESSTAPLKNPTSIPVQPAALVPAVALPIVTPRPTATPSLASASPAPLPFQPVGQSRTYIVQPGDSLPQIAAKYLVEPLALMQANHIANPFTIEAGQVLVIPPASSELRRVVVDISEQRLYAYQGDDLVYSFVVSTGQNDGTLRGSFSVLDKLETAYSEMWGFWMPDWIGIYYATGAVENGIHALPLNKNGERLWTNSLGQPVSAGCIMLAPEDAQQLYDWVVIGTPVLIRE